MKLIPGRIYTNDISSLVFKVIRVFHDSEAYIKVKGVLQLKSDGEIVERPRTYKFYKNRIDNWYVVNKGVRND